jgi:hypothetical protein
MRIEPQQGAFLIGSHHPAVTGNVAGKDGRKPSFDPRIGHEGAPSSVGPLGDVSIEATMPALGHKRTLRHLDPMSTIHPKADIEGCAPNVRIVPKADIQAAIGYYCWRARVLKFVEHHP